MSMSSVWGVEHDVSNPRPRPSARAQRADVHKVLIVDDEEDIRIVARLALETCAGWRVSVVGSGVMAIHAARLEQPHVILLDVSMPGMDGPMTLARLRADPQTAHIPVIFLTARVQSDDMRRYVEFGGLGVIAKPFDPLSIADDIRRLVHAAAV